MLSETLAGARLFHLLRLLRFPLFKIDTDRIPRTSAVSHFIRLSPLVTISGYGDVVVVVVVVPDPETTRNFALIRAFARFRQIGSFDEPPVAQKGLPSPAVLL